MVVFFGVLYGFRTPSVTWEEHGYKSDWEQALKEYWNLENEKLDNLN